MGHSVLMNLPRAASLQPDLPEIATGSDVSVVIYLYMLFVPEQIVRTERKVLF